MIYIIIMIVATTITIPVRFKNRKQEKISKIFLFLSFIIAYFFMAVRYNIGTDYSYIYVPYFYGIGNGTMAFPEEGFNLLNKVIYILTGDYRILFAITSLIFIGLIYLAIKENSTNITISVLMIFLGQSYFYSMNMVRQAIAIAIIFYAYKYIKKKQFVKYLLASLLAFTIHNTSIVMIPTYFIANLNMTRKTKVITALGIIAIASSLGRVIQNVLINTKYYMYYDVYGTGNITTLLLITNILIFILSLYYHSKDDKEYNILSNINFMGFCMIIIGAYIPLVDRIVRYFTIFQILLVPKILEKEQNQKIRITLKLILFGVLFAIMYYQIILLKGEAVYPYQWIFKI